MCIFYCSRSGNEICSFVLLVLVHEVKERFGEDVCGLSVKCSRKKINKMISFIIYISSFNLQNLFLFFFQFFCCSFFLLLLKILFFLLFFYFTSKQSATMKYTKSFSIITVTGYNVKKSLFFFKFQFNKIIFNKKYIYFVNFIKRFNFVFLSQKGNNTSNVQAFMNRKRPVSETTQICLFF